MIKSIALCVCAYILASAPAAFANPITYEVDQTFGGGATVTGTITTDGNIGALTSADIIDWDLVGSNGSVQSEFTKSDSSVSNALQNALTASLTSLSYNFDIPDEGLIFINLTDQNDDVCWSVYTCENAPGIYLALKSEYLYSESESGTQVIATALAVPEPPTLAVLIAGLSVFGGLVMIRKKMPLS
jgi:opacity protein-like surface antigen